MEMEQDRDLEILNPYALVSLMVFESMLHSYNCAGGLA